MITVYTCILGAYDNLRPSAAAPGVRYVCYSDTPQHCPPWEIQPAYKPLGCDHRNSRIPKILAHLHAETEYSLWIDGSLSLKANPVELVDRWLRNADLAFCWHPCRRNVYEELEFCLHYKYGDAGEVRAQVEGYRREGLPAKSGLWSGGVILRRHTPAVERFNLALWQAYRAGSIRDQLAIPYAVWKTRTPVATIGGPALGDPDNPLFPFHWHAEVRNYGDNESYREPRARAAARREQLRRLCQ